MSSSTTRLVVVHALSPLHAGTGQSTGAIDLPIARDRATSFPLLPGSSLKGALRARGRAMLGDAHLKLFGPETDNASEYGGSVTFTDARLALLPVRSVRGTFAWVTSPYLLAQLARDAKLAGAEVTPITLDKPNQVSCTATSTVRADGKVILEDFDLEVIGECTKLADQLAPLLFADPAWRDMLKKRLCVVHDDTMKFLATHATDVATRVSIDPDTGTAKRGQLWTEENLPTETVLVGLAEEVPGREHRAPGGYLKQLGELVESPIQLGGKATVGRGRCDVRLAGGR